MDRGRLAGRQRRAALDPAPPALDLVAALPPGALILRVLTYNCCALPWFTGDIAARLERIGAELAALRPELVVLQEVFFPTHLELLRRRLPDYQLFTSIRSWRTFGGGLAVFSQFPLRDPQYVRFRQQGSLLRYTALARVSRKGMISARVEPPSGPAFSLVATHPVANYQAWRRAGEQARGRRSTLRRLWQLGAAARGNPYPRLQADQLAQLEEHLGSLPRDRPLVVAGDLNVPPDSPQLRGLLERAGLEDAMAGETQPSFPSGRYYRMLGEAPGRIDYVLHRAFQPGASRYVLTRPRPLPSGRQVTLSDHFGVLVELTAR